MVFALIIAMASNGKSKHTPNTPSTTVVGYAKRYSLRSAATAAVLTTVGGGGPRAGLPNWTRSRLIRKCRCVGALGAQGTESVVRRPTQPGSSN